MWTADSNALTADAGAYILLLRLSQPATLPPRWKDLLKPGVYAYAGSALGPGGIRARCARHLRGNKVKHWHVDWISTLATERRVATFDGLGECSLLDRLLATGATLPVPGFGSSDCRRCRSHLAMLTTPWSHAALARLYARLGEVPPRTAYND